MKRLFLAMAVPCLAACATDTTAPNAMRPDILVSIADDADALDCG